MMRKVVISLLMLLFLSVMIIESVRAEEYKDPRNRYTINLPEKWSILDDGRMDVFKTVKEKTEGYLTIMSFPPPMEEESIDDVLKNSISILEPDKILKQDKIDIMDSKGAFIDCVKKIKSEKKEVNTRKQIYFIFRKNETITLTFEAPEENFNTFEEDFKLLKESFKLTCDYFGGQLYINDFYSIILPYNWGIGPDTGKEIYFVGLYDKGFSFCDVTKMARPQETSNIKLFLDYWKDEIKKTDHKITETRSDLLIDGKEGAMIKHEYIQDTGKSHIVEDYIFMKGSYLFIVSFDTSEDFYNNFTGDFDFILKGLKIEID